MGGAKEETMRMPDLTTARLIIREFRLDDLEVIHRILDEEAHMETQALEDRRLWLEWTVRNYAELAKLYQFPYGDRAVTLRSTGALIGAAGFVPVTVPLGQLAGFAGSIPPEQAHLLIPEVGLFYAFSTAQRGKGYATEAAQALLDYAFQVHQLRRVVANTDYDNLPSQAVMRRLGMRVERNTRPDPPWFQILGVLEHPGDKPEV
jgi:[ribosomal protein S5]-alanine N-acetyltransferase